MKANVLRMGFGLTLVAMVSLAAGCGKHSGATKARAQVISNSGSDTMVNLAQMWAEDYRGVKPGVSVEVSGGGSGVGIRDLMQGLVDIANLSREMKDSEKEQARRNTGKEPVEWIIGYDALGVYVHKDNPVDTLSLAQLKEVYAEGGSIDKWSKLGVELTSLGGKDEIVRVSRQNSSGTYFYFREVVLNDADYKPGSLDMSGSKDVVELVGKSLGAIGYSGMGYANETVKFVKLSKGEGTPSYEPSLETVAAGHYPLARALYMVTLGQPEGAAKEYLDWIMSPAGQAIVANAGYIPYAAAGK